MSTANWRKYSVKKFLKAIEGSGGNITVVCQRMGCHRDTFMKAMDENPELKHALDVAEEEFGDLVEGKIAQHIKEGNVTMTIFYAKTKLKKRGYIESAIIHEGAPLPMLVDDIPADGTDQQQDGNPGDQDGGADAALP